MNNFVLIFLLSSSLFPHLYPQFWRSSSYSIGISSTRFGWLHLLLSCASSFVWKCCASDLCCFQIERLCDDESQVLCYHSTSSLFNRYMQVVLVWCLPYCRLPLLVFKSKTVPCQWLSIFHTKRTQSARWQKRDEKQTQSKKRAKNTHTKEIPGRKAIPKISHSHHSVACRLHAVVRFSNEKNRNGRPKWKETLSTHAMFAPNNQCSHFHCTENSK